MFPTKRIPKLAYLNAQVVGYAAEKGHLSSSIEVFRSKYSLESFSVLNQAHLVSLLYCLIVAPKQLADDDEHYLGVRIAEEFSEMQIAQMFDIEVNKIGKLDINLDYALIRHLRNAVAHVRYSFDDTLTMSFWDHLPKKPEEITCKASISCEKLSHFLELVGSKFANSVA